MRALLLILLASACSRPCRVGTRDCGDGYFCSSERDGTCMPIPSADDAGSDAPGDAGLTDAGHDETCLGGSCYWLVPTQTWSSAESACAAGGGHLVTVGSEAEQTIAWALAMPVGMPVWIGATDEGSEGMWRWSSGEVWSEPVWAVTPIPQPDNADGAQHCAIFWTIADGRWADDFCESMYPAMCERSAP